MSGNLSSTTKTQDNYPIPDLGIGQETKLSYAPDVDSAENYLRSIGNRKGFDVMFKRDANGVPIKDNIGDLYLVNKKQAINKPEDLDKYGTKASLGLIGSVAHAALPTVGATVVGGLMTPADIASGPGGTIAGGAIGAAGGSALNQVISHKLFPQEKTVTGNDLLNVGLDTAFGAATPAIGYAAGKFLGSARSIPQAYESMISPKLPLGESQIPYASKSIALGKFGNPESSAILNSLNEQIPTIAKQNLTPAEQILTNIPGAATNDLAAQEKFLNPGIVGKASDYITGKTRMIVPESVKNAADIKLAASSKESKIFIDKLKDLLTQGGSTPTQEGLDSFKQYTINKLIEENPNIPEETIRNLSRQIIDIGRGLESNPDTSFMRGAVRTAPLLSLSELIKDKLKEKAK